LVGSPLEKERELQRDNSNSSATVLRDSKGLFLWSGAWGRKPSRDRGRLKSFRVLCGRVQSRGKAHEKERSFPFSFPLSSSCVLLFSGFNCRTETKLHWFFIYSADSTGFKSPWVPGRYQEPRGQCFAVSFPRPLFQLKSHS
jgi:hypothetical protein